MRMYHPVHDADYRQSKKDFDAFVEKMTEKITEIDETIPELPPKDLVSILHPNPSKYQTRISAETNLTDVPYIPRYTLQQRSDSIQGNSNRLFPPYHDTQNEKEFKIEPSPTDTFLRRLVQDRPQRSLRSLLPPDQPFRLLHWWWSLVPRSRSPSPYAPSHRSKIPKIEKRTTRPLVAQRILGRYRQ